MANLVSLIVIDMNQPIFHPPPPPPPPMFAPTSQPVRLAVPPPPAPPRIYAPTPADKAKQVAAAKVVDAVVTAAMIGAPPFVPPKQRINVRDKGQRGEREVIGHLQSVVNRVRLAHSVEPLVLQRNALQAHLGGADLHGLDGYSVEVKFVEQETVATWWKQTLRQAAAASKPNRHPVVPILFYRASRCPWTVMFRAYVQTPRDTQLVEMDMEVSLDFFLQWFEEAYTESVVEELQSL